MDADRAEDFDPIIQFGWDVSEEIRSVNGILFTPAIDLIEEATRCHQNQCFLASAVMCRAAIESTLFTIKIWKRNGSQYHPGTFGRETLEMLIVWAQGKGLLNAGQVSQATKIREKGNLGAHMGAQIEKALLRKPLEVSKARIPKEDSLELIHQTGKLLVELVQTWNPDHQRFQE